MEYKRHHVDNEGDLGTQPEPITTTKDARVNTPNT